MTLRLKCLLARARSDARTRSNTLKFPNGDRSHLGGGPLLAIALYEPRRQSFPSFQKRRGEDIHSDESEEQTISVEKVEYLHGSVSDRFEYFEYMY